MTIWKWAIIIRNNKWGRFLLTSPFLFWKEEQLIKKESTTQEWLPFEKILDNGIIVEKDAYVKIIKVLPINYSLKSNLEKEAVLNSYKLFLKTCDFNIQILIQSKKESLSKTFFILKEKSQKEKEKIRELIEKYKEFVLQKNNENKSASKNFYIIIKIDIKDSQKDNEKQINEQIAINKLSENFFKIKEALSRCGNIVYDISEKTEIVYILSSFVLLKNKEKGEW